MVAASPENFDDMTVAGNEFLRRLEGMTYGEDPRAGFFQGSLFVHPDLAFVFRFPEGWATQNAADAVTGISPNRDAIIQFRGSRGTPVEAAERFLAQEGIQSGPRSTGRIHGNPAISAEFAAQSQDGGSVRGTVTFVEYDGATWGILAYSTADRFSAYSPAFVRSMNSFERLTDPAALAVQPMRVRIVAVPRAMSLQQFHAETPSGISLAELAMINGLEESAQLRSGQLMKRVTGTPIVVAGRPGHDPL